MIAITAVFSPKPHMGRRVLPSDEVWYTLSPVKRIRAQETAHSPSHPNFHPPRLPLPGCAVHRNDTEHNIELFSWLIIINDMQNNTRYTRLFGINLMDIVAVFICSFALEMWNEIAFAEAIDTRTYIFT